MMAGGAFFDISVAGKGSHGARPEEGIDPVLTACHITTALQAVVSRNISPAATAVLSVTSIKAGDAYNVIPQTAVIRGTVRTFSNDTMSQIEDCTRRTATGVAAAFGAIAKLDFPDVWTQLVNDPVETQFIADVAADLVGEAHVDRNRSLIMGSEDFAYMLEARPSAFINIGIGDTDGPLHNPRYDFNDEALPIGASLFARLVEKKLRRPNGSSELGGAHPNQSRLPARSCPRYGGFHAIMRRIYSFLDFRISPQSG
jgi:amidohydrolase